MIFTPEPYQQEFIDFLLTRQRAAGFLSPGLGKTASTLSALNTKFLDGEIRAALVIAPLRVANLTWPNEIAKWDQFRWMRHESLRKHGPSGKSHIYLVNYESLPKLKSLDFCDVVILDELTRAKNPKSTRIKHLDKLLTKQERWGLTGTPRPNSLLELFAQVRILDGGARLGRSFNQFRETYFYPTDYMRYNWLPKPGAEEKVYARIADLSLTMRASDYLDIPDTIVEDIEVALPDTAQKAYRELEKELLLTIRGKDVVAQTAATLVNKLLQITGGYVYSEERESVMVHEAKVARLKKLVESVGENVIIFTNYRHERAAVVKALGATDAEGVKGDLETQWNRGQLPRLVADPRSLGHGLNLQEGGRTIIWYSQTWSRELYDQAIARVARKGQGKQPMVYRLICPGTIDDAVVETLRTRGESQSVMMDLMRNFEKQCLLS